MFKRAAVIFLLLMCYALPLSAKTYTVTAEALNVRSGPGMQHGITGVLKRGEKIGVEEFVGNWAKIKTEDGSVAFVSKKSITASNKVFFLILPAILFFIVFASCILFKRLKSGFKRRCKQCKKWGALQEHSQELIGTKDSTIVKVAETKNRRGEVTSTREYFVPATIYVYRVTELCKYCGNTIVYNRTIKLEN